MSSVDIEPLPLVQWLDRRTRRHVTIAGVGVALYVIWQLVRWSSAVQLDRWWLDSMSDAPIWTTRVQAELLLAVISGLTTFGISWPALRASHLVQPPAGQKTFRPIAFVAGRLGPVRRWATWLIPLYLTYRVVPAATGAWTQWVLFRNGAPSGADAPAVGHDIAYHLFTLPLLTTALNWLLLIVGITFATSVLLLALNGALRLPTGGRTSAPAALRLLRLLGGSWIMVRGVKFWFVDHPSLASSRLGRFDGAGYAEMHTDGIVYRPLAVATVVAGLLLISAAIGVVRPAWSTAATAVVALVYVVVVLALTPVVQRFVVNPSEAELEAPYVAHNLDATKLAYGLEVEPTELDVDPNPTAVPDLSRLPIFEQTALAEPFQVLQGTRATKVTDVDLDRYPVDGQLRPVYVAARSAAVSELPERGWVNEKLVYTHGDGVIAALADEPNPGGGIDFSGLESMLGDADTDLYFGENLDNWYVFVGTDRAEFDDGAFEGTAGVDVNSRWRQLIVGLALGDRNAALTSEFNESTQLLLRRSIDERIHAIAPFLAVDGDPYAVITDDGIVWMVDTYVTSSTYPYAQQVNLGGLPPVSGLAGNADANYVRHAATVTVDAASGEIHFYRTSDDEPILDVWSKALPGLFEDSDQLPATLAAHRRYPTDGFTVQTNMLGRYHAATAEQLFTGNDAWLISPALISTPDGPTSQPSNAVWQFADELGGDWATVRPFSPGQAGNPGSSRDELAALAVGDHDTGRLSIFDLSSTSAAQLPTPQVAQSIIASDPEISQLLTLLNANGSTVQYGPNTPVIADGALTWFRTIVVQSTANIATPRLYSRLVVIGGGVTMFGAAP